MILRHPRGNTEPAHESGGEGGGTDWTSPFQELWTYNI